MRVLMCLSVAGALAWGCSNSAAAAVTAPTQIPLVHKIVAFGDSLTSGHGLAYDEAYPAVLERMLRSAGLPFVVSNHGVSGETTADAVLRLDAALAERPAILIVALGANDGLEGVPLTVVRANLDTIIGRAQQQDIKVLLCGMEALPFHGIDYFLRFRRIFPAVADEYDVPLVPFFLTGIIGNREMLLPDLVHPNAAGAAQIAQAIWPYVLPLARALVAPEPQVVS